MPIKTLHKTILVNKNLRQTYYFTFKLKLATLFLWVFTLSQPVHHQRTEKRVWIRASPKSRIHPANYTFRVLGKVVILLVK
jgi:hypothetical protein